MLKTLWIKRKDKRGFTLVELIVVLIILTILAALLIPALTGYIDKAKEKQIIAETRQAVMAAQTLGDEAYAATGKKPIIDKTTSVPVPKEKGKVYLAEIEELADVPAGSVSTVTYNPDASIAKLVYKHGKTCTYTVTAGNDAGDFTVK